MHGQILPHFGKEGGVGRFHAYKAAPYQYNYGAMDGGIVLIDKEEGRGSRYYDALLSKAYPGKKAGHLGTLDPFASGLLVVAVGKGTKFLPYLEDEPKSYIAVLSLGERRDTADLTGATIERAEVPSLELDKVAEVLSSFKGEIEQLPPSYSAVKVNGRPAYSYARKGEAVELRKRKCLVSSINLVSFHKKEIVFTASVSKGTYIRTLGEDIALRLGTLGYLSSLRRLSMGKMMVDRAIRPSFGEVPPLLDPLPYLKKMKHYEILEGEERAVRDGKRLRLPSIYGEEERVLVTYRGEALAVYLKDGDEYRSERGLF